VEYFLEFHWWYVPSFLVLLFVLFGNPFFGTSSFGKYRGGVVRRKLVADLEVLDPRFGDCVTEASYNVFKQGTPDHIEIELENLPLDPGEALVFEINQRPLAECIVAQDREAEFDHWSDENVKFPVIQEADELVVKHAGTEIFRGTFQLDR